MSASESLCNFPSEPPTHYRGSNDSQWTQETNTNNNIPATVETPLQWSELPQQMVPVSRHSSVLNHQKLSNGVNNLSSFNTRNHIDTYVEPTNGFCVPNASRALMHIPPGTSVMYPGVESGTGLTGINGWNNGLANTSRFISRPNWTTTNTSKTGGVRKPKRIRTAFNSQQMMELEQEYARSRYLDRTRRIELAEILRLNERTIKIWFQNRRMKEKKDRAESLEESEATSTTDSSSEVGMPFIVQNQIPVANDVFNREVHIEEYRTTPAQNSMPPTMPITMSQDIQNPILNGYPVYIQGDQYEPQCRQVHLQMQHYPSPPPYNGGMQVIIEEPATQPDTSVAPTSNIIEQSWDLSWIRSIHINDDC